MATGDPNGPFDVLVPHDAGSGPVAGMTNDADVQDINPATTSGLQGRADA